MTTKTQKIISNLVDFIFSIIWISFSMPLIGWAIFGAESDWNTLTFSEFFGEKIWFNLWIISVFYSATRLLLKDKFWEMIFNKGKIIS